MASNGYGKMLEVDLATGRVVKRDIEPGFARKYLGGVGFGTRIVYDEVGKDIDPLSPENVLVFANGPFTGTRVPCAGRTEITTKHPQTGSIGSGNTGGVWGAALKHAGFDMIVFRNKADKPVYLRIEDDAVELKDAGHLWGKDARVTSDMLRGEISPRASVMAIGQAGENLVKYACPLNDYSHVAGRSGTGAVMGSKRLKAIAVRGTGVPKPARPSKFLEAVKEARERLTAADKVWWQPGPSKMKDFYTAGPGSGFLPCKNYQTGVLPNWNETRSMKLAEKYLTKKGGVCYACGMNCYNMMGEVNEGKFAGLEEYNLNRPGIVAIFGAKCAVDNLPAIWKCKDLTQRLGMDYVSASGIIAFAIELFQRGIITQADADGLDLTWGNEDAVISLIHKIAYREGFGDVLAEGSLKAAEKIGKGSEKYAMTTKGVEMYGNDPRADRKGWTIGQLTNPRGDHTKSTHFMADVYNSDWWIDKFDMPEDVKKKIYSMPPQEVFSSWEGKAMMCKWFEDLHAVVDSLGVCFFPVHMRLAFGPTLIAKMYTEFTGWNTTPEDIMEAGERVFNLFKAYTVRQGLSRKDDKLPDRFFDEPLPEGPAKGAVLNRKTIEHVLDEYYEARGWDKQTGVPTWQKLVSLGLEDVANELKRQGRIQ